MTETYNFFGIVRRVPDMKNVGFIDILAALKRDDGHWRIDSDFVDFGPPATILWFMSSATGYEAGTSSCDARHPEASILESKVTAKSGRGTI